MSYIFEIKVDYDEDVNLSNQEKMDIRNNFLNRLKGFYTPTPKALEKSEISISLPKDK